jgi:hypothetical protein
MVEANPRNYKQPVTRPDMSHFRSGRTITEPATTQKTPN